MFSLPKLFDSLEPFIDTKTMEIHYTKHHSGYVNNLNKILTSNNISKYTNIVQLLKNIDKLPEDIQTGIIKNGGGHYNHNFFWKLMDKAGSKKPIRKVKDMIKNKFNSFEQYKEEFISKALSKFGSGWVWLVIDETNNLIIESTPNQNNPYTNKNEFLNNPIPLLGLDL